MNEKSEGHRQLKTKTGIWQLATGNYEKYGIGVKGEMGEWGKGNDLAVFSLYPFNLFPFSPKLWIPHQILNQVSIGKLIR